MRYYLCRTKHSKKLTAYPGHHDDDSAPSFSQCPPDHSVPSWLVSVPIISRRPPEIDILFAARRLQHSMPPGRFHMNLSPKWHAWIYDLIWSQILILQNHTRIFIHFWDLLACLSKINNRSSNHLTAQKMTKYGEPVALAALFVNNSDTRVRSTPRNHLCYLPHSRLEPGNRWFGYPVPALLNSLPTDVTEHSSARPDSSVAKRLRWWVDEAQAVSLLKSNEPRHSWIICA